MAITNDMIQKVINTCDMVAIIGEYIKLEKKGSDYWGLCPFHDDHNASLSVSPSKHCWTCWSCHATGNVITFVQKKENISFVDALKKVAIKSNIPLDIKVSPYEVKINKFQTINAKASLIYEFYLNNTTEGKKALEYLEKRNMTPDVLKRFKVGLSNKDGNTIVKTLLETNKFLPLDLKEAGLIECDNKNNRYYDLFRGRIMFPIEDYHGNIIGFSGRIYDSDSTAKYMNTRETILFKKSEVLYNYSYAINDIKELDQVIIFEGFMDVIAAYRAGIYNAICTMGTAFTKDQVKIISKVTKNIILCYDGDEAGINATCKTIKLFHEFGMNISTCLLPDGMDPDEYINKYGKDELKKTLLNNNISSIDYLYNISKRGLNINNPSSCNSFLKAIKELIAFYNSKIIEKYLVKKACGELDLTEEELNLELSKVKIDNVKVESKPIDDFNNYSELVEASPNIDNNFDVYNLDIPEENQEYDNVEFTSDDYGYNINEENNDIPSGYFNTVKQTKIEKKPVRNDIFVSKKYLNAENTLIYLAFTSKENALRIRKMLNFEDYVDRINRDLLLKLSTYYQNHDAIEIEEFKKIINELEKEKLEGIIHAFDILYNSNDEENNNSNMQLLIKSIPENVQVVKDAKYQKSFNEMESTIEGSMKKATLKKRTLRKIEK